MEPRAPLSGRARRVRWAGTGRSDAADAALAGAAATRAALAAGDDAPRLLLVFATRGYDLPELVAAVRETAGPGVPLAGCATGRALDAAGEGADAVVVLALGGDGFSVSTAAVTATYRDPREAGAQVAACLGDVDDRDHRVLLLLADGGAVPQPSEVLRGAYSVAGAAVSLVGGVTGDAATATSLLHDGRVLQGMVVGVAIGSDAPLGVGARHGLRAAGDPLLVTRSRHGRLLELDERPAATVVQELGVPAVLGLRRRRGEPCLRHVVPDGRADGGVACDVAPGVLLWPMEGDRDAMLDATDDACRDALAALDGDPPLALVLFDCVARHAALGPDGAAEALRRVAGHASGAEVAGVATHAEFARTTGFSGTHNGTLVVLAVA